MATFHWYMMEDIDLHVFFFSKVLKGGAQWESSQRLQHCWGRNTTGHHSNADRCALELLFIREWECNFGYLFLILRTLIGFFPTKDMQTPPSSVLIQFLWIMGSVLNRMKKIIKNFSDFYFSIYREKFIEN